MFTIFCSDKLPKLEQNVTAPGYFSLLKSKLEQEKKEKEIESEKKISVEEKKKEEIISPITPYSTIYLSKIFDDPELNVQKMSIKSTKTKVQNILELVGKGAGIDFAIDPDIRGTVGALNFKDVTAGFILNYVLTHNDPQLALIKDMNVWRVVHRNKAEEHIKILEKEEVVSKVFDVNNAIMNEKFKDLLEKAWLNISADKKAFSSMFIDTDRKKIFIRGFPKNIQEFKNFLNEVDKNVTQIRIDAIIVFAEKNFNFSFGINWSGIYNRENTVKRDKKAFDFVGVGGTLQDFPTPTKSTDPNNDNLLVNPLNFALNLFTRVFRTPREIRPAQLSDTFVSIPFVFGGPDLNLRRLNLLLNAAENEEKVKIVSRPSVMTSDNEVAKILIGETIPIQATAIDILAVAVQNITSINYKDVGIALEVRPIVSPDKKMVKLELFIEESQVISGSTVTNDRGIMQNPPVIDIIKIHNKVNLRNGQTVVIGGLSRCDERRGKNKVPYLHRIPFFGKWLFTGTAENNEEFEQFIFITPTIVD
jgi:type IV pilus assembly protein PilQ